MLPIQAKKVAGVLVGRLNSPETHESKQEQHLDEHEESLRNLSEDILQAIHSKSSSGLSMALKAFMDHCSTSQDQE